MKQSTNCLKIVAHRQGSDLHSWFRCCQQSCQPDDHRRGTVFGGVELSCLINPGTVLFPTKIFSLDFSFSSFPYLFSIVVFSLNFGFSILLLIYSSWVTRMHEVMAVMDLMR